VFECLACNLLQISPLKLCFEKLSFFKMCSQNAGNAISKTQILISSFFPPRMRWNFNSFQRKHNHSKLSQQIPAETRLHLDYKSPSAQITKATFSLIWRRETLPMSIRLCGNQGWFESEIDIVGDVLWKYSAE
jgi:hypothetical protein